MHPPLCTLTQFKAYEGPFWHGTLLTNKHDAGGNLYRRNRYYDPQTARFTQEYPIGLAGGLNLYGYADGDPVTYSDPYGLMATCDPPGAVCPPEWLTSAAGWVADKIAATPYIRDLPYMSTITETRRAQGEVRRAVQARDEFFNAERSLDLSGANPNADRDAERMIGLSRAHQSQVANAGAAMGKAGTRATVNSYSAAAAAKASAEADFSLLRTGWRAAKSAAGNLWR